MTDEEVFKLYEDMLKVYGVLPDIEHEPIQFSHKVKMYKHFHMKRNNNGDTGNVD
jgi:hypothetical protein